MPPFSPYFRRSAFALLIGIALATLAVNTTPNTYYDVVEWHIADSDWLDAMRLFSPGFTLTTLVSSLLMPFFVFVIAKEAWEAFLLEHASFAGRLSLGPVLMVLGGMIAAALVWQGLSALLETADEAAGSIGWVMPFGSDIVLAFLFGRLVFGKRHPALQLLLFMCIVDGVLGLILYGLAAPSEGSLRLTWLILPLAAAGVGHFGLTRPLHQKDVSERDRQRAGQIWPWLILGVVSWVGVCASGLPPALGLLPILPAMPHGDHSFGLFAVAEGLLQDPLNRMSHLLLPAMIGVLLLLGLTRGGLDMDAFGPTTWVALGALWLAKPAGILIVAKGLRLFGLALPLRLKFADIAFIAGLMGIAFTVPVLAMETALLGGAMQEAARLGLGLSLLLGPVLVLLARRTRRGPAVPLARPEQGGKAAGQ
ncbi:Na+/H+ antiporter NhaA [Pseudorhodobacter sp.]|uniref:Na+/H+ antiporter NhaA n=1 Tax=Pseudorhodobacter sp. TaxID=1934400 RepID=UPI00264722AA|nr:Na+/H+ antiporter NhaA [Pseudorhodobacter sp.]MDN5787712.1 Na+/H+ antiporter NhaA [Pseudorhodobacter sp.]